MVFPYSVFFLFHYQIFNDYNKSSKVLTDIYYYNEDGYECILPIFKDEKIFTDIMCMNNGYLTYYHNLNNDKMFNKIRDILKAYGII